MAEDGYRKESMIAMLEMVREKYGGVEGYLNGKCGFGDEDLEKIRRNILGSC